MADVFISYSRRDKAFVTRLHEALAQQNRDTWVDWEDIPLTADWWREIQNGIEAADAFIFIISPDSIRSEVCRREIDYALASNKRFIPILHRPLVSPDEMKLAHPAINSHNWIYFREEDDFDKAFGSLITALDTDLSNVRAHTRLLVRAREWEADNKDASLLLRGDDLRRAEAWLAQAVATKSKPTPLHVDYLTQSRQAATRRQRQLLAGVSVALVVAVALGILSLVLAAEAERQRGVAVAEADRAERNAATATVAQGQAEQQAVRAENNAATAVAAQQEAQVAATAVARERSGAQSIALAGQSQVELENPRAELGEDRAVQLALFAYTNFRYTWQVERALALAVRDELPTIVVRDYAGEVTNVDWQPPPNEKRLLTGSNDGTARIYDISGDELARIQAHQGRVTRALWSPDGRRFATAGADRLVRIWSVGGNTLANYTVTLNHTLSGHTDAVVNVDWSPDGSRLVSASDDGTARVWDVISGQVLFTLTQHTRAVNYAGWSPDGSRIATASNDGTGALWNAASGELIVVLEGHRSAVTRIAWSADSTRVATASMDNTAIVWDAANGARLFDLIGHIRTINRIQFSPDGELIATASADQTAKLWNAADGTLRRTLFGHENDVLALEWSPGGNRLITVSEDGTARMWFAESGGELLVFQGHTPNSPVYSLSWSDDGTWFATAGGDGTARIWRIWRNAQALVTFARGCCVDRILTDEENIQFGLPTATPAFTPTPAPESCPAPALAAQLYPGARGRVTFSGDLSPVSVRSGPGTSFTRIGRVSPGQTFQVVGGPECAEGMTWYEILYGVGAVRGWLSEGRDEYFVEPVG